MSLRRTELRAFSAKRLAEFEAQGIRPTSTFKPKPPKMATVKRPKDTGPVRSTRELVTARSGGICELVCFLTAVHVHHRRPRRAGGSSLPDTNSASNLLGLCMFHHTAIEANRSWAYEWGLILSANADPARVPVRGTRHDSGPIWLLPDGSWLPDGAGGERPVTVYQAHHSWTPGEDKADVHYDEIPASVAVLWEVDGGYRWDRVDGLWVAAGEEEPQVLCDAGLLDEFGPVTDEKSEVEV